MFWGDIIRSYPELIGELPRECTVLDWGYEARMDFDRLRDFTATGLRAYACPTVSGYVTLFPRLHETHGQHRRLGARRARARRGGAAQHRLGRRRALQLHGVRLAGLPVRRRAGLEHQR